jgi:hypothetical protein
MRLILGTIAVAVAINCAGILTSMGGADLRFCNKRGA